jgi:hypothetical protein
MSGAKNICQNPEQNVGIFSLAKQKLSDQEKSLLNSGELHHNSDSVDLQNF